MARIDLNIVDRGLQGTSWIAENIGLTASHLDEVLEQKIDNIGALNSLPTPFARFFVAKEAFRRVKEEYLNSRKEAGFAYKQLVSDILDVYELIFNIQHHRNNTWGNDAKLEVREWNAKDNLAKLKQKMPVLYNSVQDYYQSDIREDNLYFVVFTQNGKDLLLACSSPWTGFVTPPDMDKSIVRQGGSRSYVFADQTEEHESKYSNLHIVRKSGGEYFRDMKLFGERDADFKNYMYNVLFGVDDLDERFKTIKEYIYSFKDDEDIRNDFSLKTQSMKTEMNAPLVINGLSILSSDEIDIDSYFTSSLLRVPYRISRENYTAVTYKNDIPQRDYDYLLPFKPEVFSLFEGQQLQSDIEIHREDRVTVNLYYKGKNFSKSYEISPYNDRDGRIVNLRMANQNFDLGLFPNILSSIETENNYFKLFVLASDQDEEAHILNINKINVSFFKQGKRIREVTQDENPEYGVYPPFVRSVRENKKDDCETKYYEVFGTSFDLMQINILGETGLLIPNWRRSHLTGDTYTYAIDLGTSNTFISRSKDGVNNLPQLFTMDAPMVHYMHEVPEDDQYSLINRIENSVFDSAKSKIKTEFLPALIDGATYKFPIRTALCGLRQNVRKANLFDNFNIAFFYEKYMTDAAQNVHTDIKWDEQEDMLRIFVKELLLIIKCDILQRNGVLNKTKIIWFRPLSFTGVTKSIYDNIWKGTPGQHNGEPEKILFINSDQVQCYTESEAPYYYFKKKNIITNSDAVTVIDIGGGSTDFVYFKDNQPKVANSIHFGCDVLWDNGYADFDNVRDNGIYNKYASTLKFDRKDFDLLNKGLQSDSEVKTKDIINFWLSNAQYCDILRLLSKDFKPLFVYHLTAILYYMAYMYKDNGLEAPKTIVFSGNGSKYIDNFISTDPKILNAIIDLIFDQVFGGENHVHLEMPDERKEATCYGGLYRDVNSPNVPDFVYHGCKMTKDATVGNIKAQYGDMKKILLTKYDELAEIYENVLKELKQSRAIDAQEITSVYVDCAKQWMGTSLDTYFKTRVKEKFEDEVLLNDSIFFLPIVQRIFEMTKI